MRMPRLASASSARKEARELSTCTQKLLNAQNTMAASVKIRMTQRALTMPPAIRRRNSGGEEVVCFILVHASFLQNHRLHNTIDFPKLQPFCHNFFLNFIFYRSKPFNQRNSARDSIYAHFTGTVSKNLRFFSNKMLNIKKECDILSVKKTANTELEVVL